MAHRQAGTKRFINARRMTFPLSPGMPQNLLPDLSQAITVKTIAIEEHFITPMYREKVSANEFRNFYLSSRSEQLGHDISEQNADLGSQRLAYMDAAGVDMQVLSF